MAMADFAKILSLFQEHDLIGDGTISRDEMQAFLVSCAYSVAEAEEVLALYKVNSDPVLKYKDFLLWIYDGVACPQAKEVGEDRPPRVAVSSASPVSLKKAQEKLEAHREENERLDTKLVTSKENAVVEANVEAEFVTKARAAVTFEAEVQAESLGHADMGANAAVGAMEKARRHNESKKQKCQGNRKERTRKVDSSSSSSYGESDASDESVEYGLLPPAVATGGSGAKAAQHLREIVSASPGEGVKIEDESVASPDSLLFVPDISWDLELDSGCDVTSSRRQGPRAVEVEMESRRYKVTAPISRPHHGLKCRGRIQAMSGVKYSSRMRAMSAVKEDGLRLKFCSLGLRGDKVVALEAAKNNGLALEFCSETLRMDKDVAIEAVKQDGRALQYCSESLRNDQDVAIEALASDSVHLLRGRHSDIRPIGARGFTSAKFLTAGLPRLAARTGYWHYEMELTTFRSPQVGWASSAFRFQVGSVSSDGVGDDIASWGADCERSCLWHQGNAGEWRTCAPGQTMCCAVSIDEQGYAQFWFSIDGDWEPNPALCGPLGADYVYPAVSGQLEATFRCLPQEMVFAAPAPHFRPISEVIKEYGEAFQYCSDELRNDKAFCIKAIQYEIQAFLHCTEALRNDKDVAIEAVKRGGRALQHCSEKLRGDKDVVLEAVKRNGLALEYCSETLRNDEDLAMEAVKRNGLALKYCSEIVRNNKEVAMEAVERNGRALEHCSERLRNDKQFVLQAVKRNGRALGYCSETLRIDKDVAFEALKTWSEAFTFLSKDDRNDKQFVIETVRLNGHALKHCSQELRCDKDVVVEALKTWPGAFKFFSEEDRSDKQFVIELLRGCPSQRVPDIFKLLSKELQNNRELAMESVKLTGYGAHCFKYCSMTLRNDKGVAIEAVKHNGAILEHCSETLRNDKDVAMEAVKQNGLALNYCSETLRDDKDLAIEAVKRNGSAIEYCSETLRNDKDVVLEALKTWAEAFKFFSEDDRNDKQFVIEALKRNSRALEYCAETLRNDHDVAIEALKLHPDEDGNLDVWAHKRCDDVCDVFKSLSKEMQNKKDVAMTAVKTNGRALNFCSEALRNDKDIAMEALKTWAEAFTFLPEDDRNDKQFVIAAVQLNGQVLEHCSETLRNDKDVAIEAVKENFKAMQYWSEKLRRDKDVVMEAVKQDGEALQFCSQELRSDKDIVMEAARKSVIALKFALNGLSQNPDCLKAAGLMKESAAATDKRPEKGIFSVKFGFNECASNLSTVMAADLATHQEMSKFEIYNPNLYCKKSCDPNFTALTWPCRGTESTCTLEQNKRTTDLVGKPTRDTCWRLSFRLHQMMCKQSGGFMLQLEEYGKLGAGQEIETLMAKELDLKIFRFRWNYNEWSDSASLTNSDARSCIANQIADAVLDWFADEKRDTTMQLIDSDLGYRSKRFGSCV